MALLVRHCHNLLLLVGKCMCRIIISLIILICLFCLGCVSAHTRNESLYKINHIGYYYLFTKLPYKRNDFCYLRGGIIDKQLAEDFVLMRVVESVKFTKDDTDNRFDTDNRLVIFLPEPTSLRVVASLVNDQNFLMNNRMIELSDLKVDSSTTAKSLAKESTTGVPETAAPPLKPDAPKKP